ncbi:S26 family signal peptidase [Caulobacter sp. LARHSG274]
MAAASCLLLGLGDRDRLAPRVLFNTTASAPVGFYVLAPGRPVVGEWVAILPPRDLAHWMAYRRYLPANVPLLKQVAAAPGQRVCGRDGVLSVDGAPIARMRPHDRWGRALGPFVGCHRLSDAEVLLVNRRAPDSLDSRYFGPLPVRGLVGRARPLWTWDAR